VAPDDLNTPLGQDERHQDAGHGGAPSRRQMIPVFIAAGLGGLLALSLLVFAGWALFADNPFGGEPAAVASLGSTTANPGSGGKTAGRHHEGSRQGDGKDADKTPDKPGDKTAQSLPDDDRTITIIDGTSGERKKIVLNGPGTTPATPASAPGSRLTEAMQSDPLPRIAADGKRPSELYAQPVSKDADPHTPRIAIVFTGLGVGATSTTLAMSRLPGPVTFAFVPYSADVATLAASARKAGHELLLQVPMEPFDYPDNDTGPQTLLTASDTSQNIERLHWAMGRMQGYVGLCNLAGARFTASEPAMEPILKDTAARGLIYFDDGSSPRSVASQIAAAQNLSIAKADLVIDATATPTEIDRSLSRLEQIARKNGIAVGMAHALPASITHVATWASAAQKRGFVLVPITAAAVKAKSS
jgi:polysaccharide deacetylase 2 family uncharacterized protein YibQ